MENLAVIHGVPSLQLVNADSTILRPILLVRMHDNLRWLHGSFLIDVEVLLDALKTAGKCQISATKAQGAMYRPVAGDLERVERADPLENLGAERDCKMRVRDSLQIEVQRAKTY